MEHDVFLCYSARDQTVADTICDGLEQDGIRCWLASRDITPGQNWGGAIIDAIASSRGFVIIFSAESNRSQQVLREVERALSKGVPIIPFKIEDVIPSSDLEYYLSAPQWLNAVPPPLDHHITRLARSIRRLLEAAPREVAGGGKARLRQDVAAFNPTSEKRSSKRAADSSDGVKTGITVAASLVAHGCRYLEKQGIAAAEVCRAAGIDPGIVDAPDTRISGAVAENFWRAALALSGDPDLGLHLSSTMDPGALNIVGYVLLNCHNAGQVLEKAARLIGLLNDGIELSIGSEGAFAVVRSDTRNLGFSPPFERQVVEAALAALVYELRLLTETDVRPVEVRFRHAQPSTGSGEHSRVFGAPVKFSQTENCLLLPKAVLELPVSSANRALLAVFEQHADTLLAKLDDDETVTNEG